jgi:outer membrane biogenesis lipoprotein LolB
MNIMGIIIKFLILVCLLLVSLGLSSCSTSMSKAKLITGSKSYPKIQQQIDNNFFACQIKGRISWQNRLDKTGGYGYLYWEKKSDSSRITLYSPFNVQNLTIEITKHNQINSITKNGKPRLFIQEKELDYIKLLLPKIDNLIYWLFGVPNPKKIYYLTKQGFRQDEWIINYFNYKPNKCISSAEEMLLPQKIFLQKFIPHIGEDFIIKIIIHDLKTNC